jgi:RNA 2',3'-cyclic 3'-phosphodiesterase
VREFIAVDVGPGPGRSAAPQHLTLRFLGEVDPARNDRLRSVLEPVGARHAPFTIRLEGVGAFPSPERPRVVWVGVTGGREELLALARDVRAAVDLEFGDAAEAFVPHLTVLRVRSRTDREVAAALFAGTRPPPPPRDVAVGRFLLKESVLGARGAAHRILAEFPLSASPPRPF